MAAAGSAVSIVLWLAIVSVPLGGVLADRIRSQGALLGAGFLVFAVALFMLAPDWGELAGQALQPGPPQGEPVATYWFFAVALFGAAMTPYEVFFFSSGAIEERWTVKDLATSRFNVLVGFPLGYALAVHRGIGAPGMWTGLIAGLTLAAVLLATRLYRVTNRFVSPLPRLE